MPRTACTRRHAPSFFHCQSRWRRIPRRQQRSCPPTERSQEDGGQEKGQGQEHDEHEEKEDEDEEEEEEEKEDEKEEKEEEEEEGRKTGSRRRR